MELALNLGWGLLAILLFWQWLHIAPHARTGRHIQFVALSVLVLILFPVISVTDDLQASHNPAEVERSLRRDDQSASLHSLLPVVAVPPSAGFAGIVIAFFNTVLPIQPQLLALTAPPLTSIQNRPPPPA